MQTKGSMTLTRSYWWVTVHEPIRPGLLPLVEPRAILCHLGVVRVYLGTLHLDLGAERSDLRAQGVEPAIDDIQPGAVVLPALMLAQADALQML
jgi:hypothetical protein